MPQVLEQSLFLFEAGKLGIKSDLFLSFPLALSLTSRMSTLVSMLLRKTGALSLTSLTNTSMNSQSFSPSGSRQSVHLKRSGLGSGASCDDGAREKKAKIALLRHWEIHNFNSKESASVFCNSNGLARYIFSYKTRLEGRNTAKWILTPEISYIQAHSHAPNLSTGK